MVFYPEVIALLRKVYSPHGQKGIMNRPGFTGDSIS